ncbi:hypothetical protein JAAARDRAFT_220269 [Jaapia argillacea MUCL 33604]|uniref:Guanylate-binding protein N-terminal domain-containing protein n=1 Tax=Jaapia argillacea MUCL 33604 TaxID=933084 RepID=A0A067QB87_9AGAM|nr:hypothetical protein JAAARDRAFT_220269 [Jaapia argillacea MUCL 33604]
MVLPVDMNEDASSIASHASEDAVFFDASDVMPQDDDSQSFGYNHISPVSNPVTSANDASATSFRSALDLALSIPGLYRILDLVSEQGSGGLVDKVIISQDSFGRFMNDLSPGAYTSLTKVNFNILDRLSAKPLGIYGSKSEIVKFLVSLGCVDEMTSRLLLNSPDGSFLRSGLYILRPKSGKASTDGLVYVIYWPEDTTWDDGAASTVRRNRVTFMRYLSKITDQTAALLSDDHAKSLLWQQESHDAVSEASYLDDSDRLFTFHVAKSTEQEEGVTSKQGFTVDLKMFPILSRGEDHASRSDLRLSLVPGETKQGIMHVQYVPAREEIRRFNTTYRAPQLEAELRGSVELARTLSQDAVAILMKYGLRKKAPGACASWHSRMTAIEANAKTACHEKEVEMRAHLDNQSRDIEQAVSQTLTAKVAEIFPCFPVEALRDGNAEHDPTNALQHLQSFHPSAHQYLEDALKDPALKKISSPQYNTYKERLIILNGVFRSREDLDGKREELIRLIFGSGEYSKASDLLTQESGEQPKKPQAGWGAGRFINWISDTLSSATSQSRVDFHQYDFEGDDAIFLQTILSFVDFEPLLAESAAQVRKMALDSLRSSIIRKLHVICSHIRSIQEGVLKRQVRHEVSFERDQQSRAALENLLNTLDGHLCNDRAPYTFIVEDVKVESSGNWPALRIVGFHRLQTDPAWHHTVHPLELTEQDRHNIQLNSQHVPTPKMPTTAVFSFHLSVDQSLLLFNMLEDGKCLLVIGDSSGNINVYLEARAAVDGALRRPEKTKKKFHQDKLGECFLFAFDERKRTLAVCSMTKPGIHLYMFVFDETYTSLQGLGSAIILTSWYDAATTIVHIAFVSDNDEIVLIDDSARSRVFSLITQQFRPATLQLHTVPSAIYSSPDGSCLLVKFGQERTADFKAFHWSSFGSTEGIPLSPLVEGDAYVLTSVGRRNNVHLVTLSLNIHRCRSLSLQITRKITEFSFKQKGTAHHSPTSQHGTSRNCLIDCHSDVWTRFPVIPAVRRTTLSSAARSPPSLQFVSGRRDFPFQVYFKHLIATFERTTRKPVEVELSDISISSVSFSQFLAQTHDELSVFRAGEWLVDILCLIPIHIAVTRDNRFIPLKDGAFSIESEQSLLGANVGQIVDGLSFGWYESLFRSYMASKPVKVVSSMGEQSVGKSFALNHLVDTSFAGSAMRTTEGVWMSVTPTDDYLIVALDFEGVHSIERSAQEDMLLVLFNTAISNLVLFRNNFALSRDIAGLFQSFQSSSSVLDPAANPSLFQSTLAIIIKDVVDSDASEITREFSLKFNDIVQLEQGSNFISRLHRGNLHIIPWPVIESRKFYTLFATLKRCLDGERVTHSSAGVFLTTLKTLMAKLKANDWGALSQNLAAHRAQQLRLLLPRALAYGATEIQPVREPLKDYDSDALIPTSDTKLVLFVANASMGPAWDQDVALASLRPTWEFYGQRHSYQDLEWVHGLTTHFDYVTHLRLEYVRDWITRNTDRFPSNNSDIANLRREFESMAVDLKGSVQLCAMQCSHCNLYCILNRRHNGSHDCCTSHHCPSLCDFVDEHIVVEKCGLKAGHAGDHLCDIALHLCGQSCHLSNKRGCMERCTKVANHEDGLHECSASTHDCGEPCALVDVLLPDGQQHTCRGTCRVPR